MDIDQEDILKYDESLENYTGLSEESRRGEHFSNGDRYKELRSKLSGNIIGADVTLSVFLSALRSYRADRCLRPFPGAFTKNGDKDFIHLRNVCDIIPPIRDIVNGKTLSKDIVDLLYWLFIEKSSPVLKQTQLSNLPIKSIKRELQPQYVFEVIYPQSINEAFRSRQGSKDVFYAFHGSSVDNFYSILKVGLQQHFSVDKEVLFGNGVYLSSEISICTHYAPFGNMWKNSTLGHKQSIIAVCEVIDDVDKVKCRDENNRQRSHNKKSYGEIPDKYFVVTDSEMLRVKYLLLYSHKEKGSVRSFVCKNLLFVGLLLYLVLLVALKFFRSPSWAKLMIWFRS